jgi:hypothetical protein
MTDMDIVSHALPNYGFVVHSAKFGYRPKIPSRLTMPNVKKLKPF